MSIAAIVENGLIKPLEPLPTGWSEGKPLLISESEEKGENEFSPDESWVHEFTKLAAEIPEEDFAKAGAAGDDHRLIAKQQVSTEMGLD